MLLEHKTLILAVWLIFLFVAERLIAADKSVPSTDGAGTLRVIKNFALAGFNFVFSPLVIIPISLWAAGFSPADWRPEWWNGLWALCLDILILDLWIYFWHRANHEIPFLWRFHSVHHLDRTLDTSSALRFHFGEVLMSACVRAVVILALDIPIESVIVFETLVMLSAFFHHSNIRLPQKLEKALSYIIVTPSIHWVHHHAIRKDTDSNYANIFSWWDLVFRTRSAQKRFEGMPIGVNSSHSGADKSKIYHDRNFWTLILWPFRKI